MLKEQTSSENSTIGELSVDGQFECYTLEDKVRPVKIKGVTAIRRGAMKSLLTTHSGLIVSFRFL